MKKEGMSRTGFWIFIIILLGVVLGSFIFFYSVSDKFETNYVDLDYSVLQTGTEISIDQRDILRFDFDGTSYSLFVDEFSGSSAKIKLGVKPYELVQDNIQEIDLNGDGTKDLSLEFRKSDSYLLYLEFIGDFECVEDWECSEWGPCINGYKSRVCVDNNICGEEDFKPSLKESCNG